MPVAPSLGQFIQLKMSGFGEAKTGADPNSNSMWATNEGEQYFPRYTSFQNSVFAKLIFQKRELASQAQNVGMNRNQ